MRENKIRTIWKGGGAVLNGWLAIPTAFSAETMAHQGWDSLTIDLQHGVVDYQAAVNMQQTAIRGTIDDIRRVRLAGEPGRQTLLTVRTDDELDAIQEETRAWLQTQHRHMQCTAAYEGLVVDI